MQTGQQDCGRVFRLFQVCLGLSKSSSYLAMAYSSSEQLTESVERSRDEGCALPWSVCADGPQDLSNSAAEQRLSPCCCHSQQAAVDLQYSSIHGHYMPCKTKSCSVRFALVPPLCLHETSRFRDYRWTSAFLCKPHVMHPSNTCRHQGTGSFTTRSLADKRPHSWWTPLCCGHLPGWAFGAPDEQQAHKDTRRATAKPRTAILSLCCAYAVHKADRRHGELFALWFRISCATCSISLASALAEKVLLPSAGQVGTRNEQDRQPPRKTTHMQWVKVS